MCVVESSLSYIIQGSGSAEGFTSTHPYSLPHAHTHHTHIQTPRAFVVFIHLLLIKNAFLMPGKDPIYISRGRRRETKESMVKDCKRRGEKRRGRERK